MPKRCRQILAALAFSLLASRSVELLFFGRTCQGFHRRRTALDHGGHVVEVASADFLLVRHEGVTLVAGCEFRLLHHFCVVLHAFAAGVSMGELEGVESSEAFEKLIGNNELVVF
jgi:hypothetical protein